MNKNHKFIFEINKPQINGTHNSMENTDILFFDPRLKVNVVQNEGRGRNAKLATDRSLVTSERAFERAFGLSAQ